MQYFGNNDILNLPKTGFLCSQKIPAEIVLKSYDWAKQQRTEGHCIVCGNHSQIEKDVFEILLRGQQPLILVLARGMLKRIEPEIEKAISDNRLLIISPFPETITRVSRQTAELRNHEIIRLSDNLVVGYISENGQLEKVLENCEYELL